jgi:hypothetical protein
MATNLSVTPAIPSYKTNDRRGTDFGKKKAGALYPSPSQNPQNYRPRIYNVAVDTKNSVNASDRMSQLANGRSLFASLPDLGGALLSKASWSVGPNSFSPIFIGEDQEWGDEAEAWLTKTFYPSCNVLGNNFDFRTTLHLTSLALDVDGDSLMVLTKSRSGYPQIQIVPAHRIGNRWNEKEVKSGKFAGYELVDGVIINEAGRPIGYRILGDKPEDDIDISAQSCQLLYEPEWSDQYRGISRIARPLNDFTDQSDIDEFLKRGVKLASSLGLIHSTEGGIPDAGASLVGADEDGTSLTDAVTTPPFELINGGEIMYMKAAAGEKIESLKDERPSQNTQDFITRIQRRALFSCGWPIELLDPSKVGGASVRLIQDLARKTIASRQVTLERRARLIVNYAIAMAMKNEFISNNEGDWWNWSFTKGSSLTVDNGNEAAADREAFKLGTTTLADIVSKQGKDWQEVRQQSQRETEDLLDRASAVSKKYNISMDAALGLLSQRSPNQPLNMEQPSSGQTQ